MSSSLLIDEYPLVILPSLATKIGLNEAIVLQQIHYWLVRYEKANDERHNRDGRWWVYNTAEEWQENFPFWSVSTVRRTLDSLREIGLVLTGNYNQKGYDRTLWYSIDYVLLDDFDKPSSQNEQNDVSKMSTPIPETTTETTTPIARKTKTTDTRSKHPTIQAVRSITGRYPSKDIYDLIIRTVPEPDIGKMKRCWEAWRAKDFRPTNIAWLTEWYVHGIPQNGEIRRPVVQAPDPASFRNPITGERERL